MPGNETIASEALAAAAGGAISSGVLYPLEVLKTRMQADDTDGIDEKPDEETLGTSIPEKSKSSISAVGYARNLYRSEGVGVFLDGLEVSAFQSAIEKACYFFAYTALKRSYTYATTTGRHHQDPNAPRISALANVLLGCLAEWVHLPVTLPLDALTTAIQTSGSSRKTTRGSKTDSVDRQNTQVLALWMTLWKEKSFYNGIQAYWILCFKPAFQYTIFEQVKAWILRLRQNPDARLSAGEAFVLGMISRTVATLLVFPFVRAKVRMQSLGRSRDESSECPTGSTEASLSSVAASRADECAPNIWKLILENYSEGGFQSLYQGLGPELTRGVLSAALMMMVKERISGVVTTILHRSHSAPPSPLQLKHK